MSESLQKPPACFDDVMTLAEISKHLKASEKAVLRLIESGEFPASRASAQWQFRRAVVDDWLARQMQKVDSEDLLSVILTKTDLIPLPKLIGPGRILLNIRPGPKEDVLAQLTVPLVDASLLFDPDSFAAELLERESIVPTIIRDGVAVPHVRDHERSGVQEDCMVLGVCRDGTDFDALNGMPTHIFFLICARAATSHLRMLAKISLMLRRADMVEEMLACNSERQMMDLLMSAHLDLSMRF